MKCSKYLFPLAVSMTLIMLLTACTGQDNAPTPIESQDPLAKAAGTIDEYFPFEEGLRYTYDRSDVYGSNQTYIVYLDGYKMQRITTAMDLIITEVLEYSEGELKVNYAQTGASGFESFFDKTDEYKITVLKEPLELGNSWETYTGATIQGVAKGICTITDTNVEIETPYGTFNALEVSTEFENGYTNVDYYAKDIGLIKNGYFIKGFERNESGNRTYAEDVTADLLLNNFEKNASYNLEMNVYFPNENADDIEMKTKSVEFNTNASIDKILENILKNPNDNETSRLISDDTNINFIDVIWEFSTNPETNVYRETATVHLDLSKEFIENMNAGSGYEALILESIEYIFTDFYKAQNFVLTVDKEPYTSGH